LKRFSLCRDFCFSEQQKILSFHFFDFIFTPLFFIFFHLFIPKGVCTFCTSRARAWAKPIFFAPPLFFALQKNGLCPPPRLRLGGAVRKQKKALRLGLASICPPLFFALQKKWASPRRCGAKGALRLGIAPATVVQFASQLKSK
jgi:hypothetical protein